MFRDNSVKRNSGHELYTAILKRYSSAREMLSILNASLDEKDKIEIQSLSDAIQELSKQENRITSSFNDKLTQARQDKNVTEHNIDTMYVGNAFILAKHYDLFLAKHSFIAVISKLYKKLNANFSEKLKDKVDECNQLLDQLVVAEAKSNDLELITHLQLSISKSEAEIDILNTRIIEFYKLLITSLQKDLKANFVARIESARTHSEAIYGQSSEEYFLRRDFLLHDFFEKRRTIKYISYETNTQEPESLAQLDKQIDELSKEATQLENTVPKYATEIIKFLDLINAEGAIDNYIVKPRVNKYGVRVQDVNQKINIELLEAIQSIITAYAKDNDDSTAITNEIFKAFKLFQFGGKPIFFIRDNQVQFDDELLTEVYKSASTAAIIGQINQVLQEIAKHRGYFSSSNFAEELFIECFTTKNYSVKPINKHLKVQYSELDKLVIHLPHPRKKLSDDLTTISALDEKLIKTETNLRDCRTAIAKLVNDAQQHYEDAIQRYIQQLQKQFVTDIHKVLERRIHWMQNPKFNTKPQWVHQLLNIVESDANYINKACAMVNDLANLNAYSQATRDFIELIKRGPEIAKCNNVDSFELVSTTLLEEMNAQVDRLPAPLNIDDFVKIADPFNPSVAYAALQDGSLKQIQSIYPTESHVNELINEQLPINIAVEDRRLDVVIYLLSINANVNPINSEPPLFIALRNNDFQMVQLLVKNDADVSASFKGSSVMDLAMKTENIAIIHYLNEFQPLPPPRP